jgi:hypothetical protein
MMSSENRSPAWWRFPIMWLVVGGPLSVVLASIATAWLAIHGADPSLTNVPRASDVAKGGAKERSHAPAQQARNHAATPVPSNVEGPVPSNVEGPAAPAAPGASAR